MMIALWVFGGVVGILLVMGIIDRLEDVKSMEARWARRDALGRIGDAYRKKMEAQTHFIRDDAFVHGQPARRQP